MSKDLCEEMTADIFSRLPTKSLLRFRAVSKSLCARIGSPDFIRLHALRSPKKFLCIHVIFRYQHKSHKISYSLHSEDQLPYNSFFGITPINYFSDYPTIIGSCNGILCLYAVKRGVRLWNPSARRIVNIRDPHIRGGHTPMYGFGFDPIIDDYKIVRITRGPSFVYTLKTRTWRKIASRAGPIIDTHSCQVLYKGVLHQVVTSHKHGSGYYYIMTFDFSSEAISSIELPDPTWYTSGTGIIKDCLAVVSVKICDYRIWVRKEYDNADAIWSVAFKMNTKGYYHIDRLFQLTTKDDILFDTYGKSVTIYDPETQVRSEFASFSADSTVMQISECAESLELLDIETSCYERKQHSWKKGKAKR